MSKMYAIMAGEADEAHTLRKSYQTYFSVTIKGLLHCTVSISR